MNADNARVGAPANAEPFVLLRTFPLMIMYAVGFMSATYMPVWVDATAMHFGVAVSKIGMVGSLELGAVAVASILSAAFLDTRHLRWPMVAALLIGIAGNLVAGVAPTVDLFTMARLIVGLANGLLLADINLRAAQNVAPPRVFAGQIFVMVLFAIIFFTSAPHLLATFGSGSIFFYCMAVGVIALLSVLALPTSTRSVKEQADRARTPIGLAAVLILGGATLIFISNNSVWAYLAPAATGAAVSLKGLSTLLALGALLNLAAPLISGWLTGRLSPAIALPFSNIAIAACIFLIAGISEPVLYGFGALFLPFFVMFAVPFYMGILVKLDASGRCVAASSAFLMSGAAIGPAIGGLAMDRGGLKWLAITGIFITALALTATWVGLIQRTKASAT
jgi:predicted MFS family arabinose efflux permease